LWHRSASRAPFGSCTTTLAIFETTQPKPNVGYGNAYVGANKFQRQRPIGRYVCDFVCLEAGVVVELDGSQHVEQAPYYEQREALLNANGFLVLRFWNGVVFSEPEAVVQTILEALSRKELEGRFD
jgi:very-short-patch-repair endonuclease